MERWVKFFNPQSDAEVDRIKALQTIEVNGEQDSNEKKDIKSTKCLHTKPQHNKLYVVGLKQTRRKPQFF